MFFRPGRVARDKRKIQFDTRINIMANQAPPIEVINKSASKRKKHIFSILVRRWMHTGEGVTKRYNSVTTRPQPHIYGMILRYCIYFEKKIKISNLKLMRHATRRVNYALFINRNSQGK